jgi:hypothetical protein
MILMAGLIPFILMDEYGLFGTSNYKLRQRETTLKMFQCSEEIAK